MTGTTCPRCHGPLPDAIVRELPRGTACPFCSASLKRPEGRTAIEVSSPNDGRASRQVAGAPKPAVVPAAPPPVTAAAAPKNLRATMVGVAAPQRALPFDGAPAPLAIALSPPAAPAPVRATSGAVRAVAAPSAPPAARGGAAAAVARTIAAPAPARAPSVRPTVAPAAGKPARSLTPAQALDLPPPTPAPILKTPAPIPKTPASAVVMPLVTDTDSEPTHVKPPTATPDEASEPVLQFPDSEPVIDSVTMTADAEPSVPVPAMPTAPAPTRLAPISPPRRGLALLGIGMGVAIVAVAVIGVKLLRRPKAPPSAPVAAEVVKPAPEIEPVAPVLDPPIPAQPAPARAADRKAASRPAARVATPKPEPKREAPIAAKHEAASSKRRDDSHKAKAHHGGTHHARMVAKHEAAAKPSAAAPATSAGDPRPVYEKGNTLLFSGDAKSAIVAYREAVRLAPNDPIGFRGLGLAYELQSETVAAIKAFRRYLKLAPNAARPRHHPPPHRPPSRQEVAAGICGLKEQPDVHVEDTDLGVSRARVERPRPRQADVADRQPDQQRRDPDAVAERAGRQAVERIGDHAVVDEHRPVPGRADRKQQIDVLQDAQVAAQRLVVDAVDRAAQRRIRIAHDLDARAIELEAADGRVAAREVTLDLRQQRRAAQREALFEAKPVAQRQKKRPIGMTDSERRLTLRNVSSPTSSGNGRSGTDRTGRASSGERVDAKAARRHQPVVHAQPLDVGRQAADGRAEADAVDGLVGARRARISGSVCVVLRRL